MLKYAFLSAFQTTIRKTAFNNQTSSDHWNTRLVRYSSGYCNYLQHPNNGTLIWHGLNTEYSLTRHTFHLNTRLVWYLNPHSYLSVILKIVIFISRSSQVGNYISKHRSRVKWGKVRACMLKTFTRMKKRWGFLIYQFALPALQVNPHQSQFAFLQTHCFMSLFQMGREVRLTSAVTIWIPNTWNPNIGLFRIFLSGFQMV